MNHVGHTGHLNTVTVLSDEPLCASGGNADHNMPWGLNTGKHHDMLYGEKIINALCLSPNCYWFWATTGLGIKIWDLEGKIIIEMQQEVIRICSKVEPPHRTSLVCWWPDCWIHKQSGASVAGDDQHLLDIYGRILGCFKLTFWFKKKIIFLLQSLLTSPAVKHKEMGRKYLSGCSYYETQFCFSCRTA